MTTHPSFHDLIAEIDHRHRTDIAALRSKMHRISRDGGQIDAPAAPQDRSRALRCPTLTDAPNQVRVGFAYADITDLCAPDSHDTVLVFQAMVIGHLGRTTQPAAIPEDESEAWARAVLGPELAHVAYAVHYPASPPRSRRVYPAVVSRERGPILSPIDLTATNVLLFRDRKLSEPVLNRLDAGPAPT